MSRSRSMVPRGLGAGVALATALAAFLVAPPTAGAAPAAPSPAVAVAAPTPQPSPVTPGSGPSDPASSPPAAQAPSSPPAAEATAEPSSPPAASAPAAPSGSPAQPGPAEPASPAGTPSAAGAGAPQAAPSASQPGPDGAPGSGDAGPAPTAGEPAPGCGGPLAFGTITVCPSIVDNRMDVFTIRTTADNDEIYGTLIQSSGDSVGAGITDAAGAFVCYFVTRAGTCRLGPAGVYTITVTLSYGRGTGAYTLAVESTRTPSACTELPDAFFSFASPGVDTEVPAGSAGRCLWFDQPQDALLYQEQVSNSAPDGTYMVGGLYNGQFKQVCSVQYGNSTCRLSGPGPYRLFVVDASGRAARSSLRMPRITGSAGCDVLRPGQFGADGASVDDGVLQSTHVTCQRLVTAAAQRVLLRFEPNQNVGWTVYDDAGNAVCSKYSDSRSCSLPAAGGYTILVTSANTWGSTIGYQASATALDGTAGCAEVTDTTWDQAALLVHQTSQVQVNCHRFTGQAGERMITYASPTVYNEITTSLVDASGVLVCTGYTGEDGCVLPATGTYRLVSYLSWWWADQGPDATYQVQIRRLSAPEGCPTVTPGAYGAAPAGAPGGIRCRTLDIPAAGSYRVTATDPGGFQQWIQVYDQAGRRVCSNGSCSFPAAGRYTLVAIAGSGYTGVVDLDVEYAVTLLPWTPSDCPVGSDDPATITPVTGTVAQPGQVDCVRLASPAGARIVELLPTDATGAGDPSVSVLDATGAYLCDSGWSLRQWRCELTGTAPFFAVITPQSGVTAGGYQLAFPRVDGATGCQQLPAGGATFTTDAGHFATCYTLPADQHASQETFTFQRTAGTGKASLVVFSDAGGRSCGTLVFPRDEATMTCSSLTGPVTVFVEAAAVDGSWQVTHTPAATPAR